MDNNIDFETIEKVIGTSIFSMDKITYGYTNDIYVINERYILRICKNEKNYENFLRASMFCKKYYNKINCPKILYSSLDKENKNIWQLEEKIEGTNLFFAWKKLSKDKRELVIKNICKEMKKLNKIPLSDNTVQTVTKENWRYKFKNDIYTKLKELENKGISYPELYSRIMKYINENIDTLSRVSYKICHADLHFDNILIDGNYDVRFLDYDRLRVASLDYELNIFNIIEHTPELVVNKKMKNVYTKDDFKGLLDMVKKYYPELFEFNELDVRLNIYAIKQYLRYLEIYNDSPKEKKIIMNMLESMIKE